jgi:hypothetical protein
MARIDEVYEHVLEVLTLVKTHAVELNYQRKDIDGLIIDVKILKDSGTISVGRRQIYKQTWEIIKYVLPAALAYALAKYAG